MLAAQQWKEPGLWAPFCPLLYFPGIKSMFGGLLKVTRAGLELRLRSWTPDSRSGAPPFQSSGRVGYCH